MKILEVDYTKIRSQLKTGDNVLFQGRGVLSWIIATSTFGPWSHMGKIIRIGSDVFVLESTKITSKIQGVQMSLLSVRIAQYKGRVAIRRLLDVKRDLRFLEITDEFRMDMKGKLYEQSIWQLLGAAMPWKNKRDLTSVFCSEMAAEYDIRQGILPSFPPSNEYHPNDYGLGRYVDRHMLKGRLGKPVFVSWRKGPEGCRDARFGKRKT